MTEQIFNEAAGWIYDNITEKVFEEGCFCRIFDRTLPKL